MRKINLFLLDIQFFANVLSDLLEKAQEGAEKL